MLLSHALNYITDLLSTWVKSYAVGGVGGGVHLCFESQILHVGGKESTVFNASALEAGIECII